MSDGSLLSIRKATVCRGSTAALRDISLDIGRGEQVAVLGPNGAGKTTLLKLLNRELYPVRRPGSVVRVLGREAWNVWELRRHIGLVSDDLEQRYPRKAVGLDVVLSGYFSSIGSHGLLADEITGAQVERARSVLTEVGAAEFEDVPIERMSTGERRRCLLARALVHSPHTLILDEPTAGLDLAACFDHLARIRRLIADGRSILLVTHHLNDIAPEIDRVVLLSAGRVVADGPKQAVLTEQNLSKTFGVRLRLLRSDGFYFALPHSG